MTSYQNALDDDESGLLSDFLNISDNVEEEDDEGQANIEDMLLHSDPTNAKERKALHKNIMKNYSTKAVAVIFILHIQHKTMYDYQREENETEEEDNPEEHLEMIQKARTLFENEIFNRNLKLVKYDDIRIFAVSKDATAALTGMLCAKKWVRNISTPTMSMDVSSGCERGPLFLIPKDYFGNPVNIASKLGEDTAKPGEALVSLGNGSSEAKYIKAFTDANFTPKAVHISGVHISYFSMEEKIQKKMLCVPKKRSSIMNRQISAASFTSIDSKKELEWQELIFLQSDLSGFTRLTKKYGILHFLTIIVHCRKIFNDNLQSCEGSELIMYDGDNIIIKFTSSVVALKFILQVTNDLDIYNKNKEKDFHIRAKFGAAKGKVLISEDGDIAGEAWEHCCSLSEDKAEVGEILVTEAVKKDLEQHTFGCSFDLRPASDDCPLHYNVIV